MCEVYYQWGPETALGAPKEAPTECALPRTYAHSKMYTGKWEATEPLQRGPEHGALACCSSQMPSDDESVPRGVCLEIPKLLFANPVWPGPSSGLLGVVAERRADLHGETWSSHLDSDRDKQLLE